MHQPTAAAVAWRTTQSEQHKARMAALEILVQYLLSAFYTVENNTHLKVFHYEHLIFTLLKVIDNVHKNITTESPLNLMLIYKRLIIRRLKSCRLDAAF